MITPRPLIAALAVAGITGPLIALGTSQPGPPAPRTEALVAEAPPVFAALPPSIADPRGARQESAGAEGEPAPPAVYEALPDVVVQGDGRLQRVPGQTTRRGSGPLKQYSVAVEGGLGIDPASFAAAVDATLGDRRSWGAGGRMSFQRVASGDVDFRVVLASPKTTDRLCAPLSTEGKLSCAVGGMAVINALRWQRGADAYQGRLAHYRQYVVNHEVGHELGHGHARCPGAGRLAPVMMQQTIGVGACLASPWPHPSGR